MAVSGKTAAPWEIPYLAESDIPDMGAGDKAIAERVATILSAENQQNLDWLKKGTEKQLIVCNSSGVPQYVAMGGDATLAEDGTLTVSDGAITSRKFKPTAGAVAASEDLTVSDTIQDIPGSSFEITAAVSSLLLLTATFTVFIECTTTTGVRGSIQVDAKEQTAPALLRVQSSTLATISQSYAVSLTAGTHKITQRAGYDVGNSPVTCNSFETGMVYLLVAA